MLILRLVDILTMFTVLLNVSLYKTKLVTQCTREQAKELVMAELLDLEERRANIGEMEQLILEKHNSILYPTTVCFWYST